jgi:signal transduction histidine kinase
VTWLPTVLAALLLASTGLAAWAAIVARGRRTIPGSDAFAWMMFATAYWALLAALHAIVPSISTRITVAKFQYLGIAAVAPLWFVFTSQYARERWIGDPILRAILWVIPITTVITAFTNDWHLLLWSSITPVDDGTRLVYGHGPWFWVALTFNYFVLGAGTFLLFRALRRFPLPYRRQTALITIGALIPWASNVLYVAGLLPSGIDATPLAFAVSGTAILWGFHRHRLLGLVPIARDLLIDSMDDGILVLDQYRHIVDINPPAERMTGCTIECVGVPVDRALAWWTESATEEGVGRSPRIIEVNNHFLEIEITAVRDGQERFAGWLVLLRDITARRHSEIERRRLERRLFEQQKLESLGVLAGGVAHDFNNLLTGILGNADLLAMAANENPELRTRAEAIVIGAQRAADVVAKMLAYAGEGQVMSELVDLDELIRELLDLLQASVARHCHLEYRGQGPLPRIKADPSQVRQIVMNLIVNASEAVDDGGTITVSGGSETLNDAALAGIEHCDATPGRFAYIDVHDNGPGMSTETLRRIFDPFFSTKQTGRGLGLAAVRGIVRGHKGALRVITSPGQGTGFRVWLPLEPQGRHSPSA